MNRYLTAILLVLLTGLLTTAAAGVTAAQPDTVRCERAPRLWPALTSAGVGLAVNAAATEVLKHSVHETRPDGSSDNSFPSRHTSWAFAVSTALSNQFYGTHPWVSLGGQLVASGIGVQRVYDSRHFGGDVAAGAIVGMASAELGQVVSRWIFGGHSPLYCPADARFATSVAVSSELILPLGSDFRSGFGTTAHFVRPLWRSFGVRASAGVFSIAAARSDLLPLSGIDFSAGATWRRTLPVRSLAFVADADVGLALLHDGEPNLGHHSCSVKAGAGLAWHLTESFAAQAGVSYRLLTGRTPLHAIAVSVSSVWLF